MLLGWVETGFSTVGYILRLVLEYIQDSFAKTQCFLEILDKNTDISQNTVLKTGQSGLLIFFKANAYAFDMQIYYIEGLCSLMAE